MASFRPAIASRPNATSQSISASVARRFEPARCLVLDDELRVDLAADGRLPADARVIAADGRVAAVDAV